MRPDASSLTRFNVTEPRKVSLYFSTLSAIRSMTGRVSLQRSFTRLPTVVPVPESGKYHRYELSFNAEKCIAGDRVSACPEQVN